ncbi:MAG TPA: phosphate acetyltransferase [Polyangiaceae bacterium]|nr:phosphate acetyltransferase [Polyangiaceae bacterium]
MPHTLFLAPIGSSVGLTSVALGVLRALDSRGVRVAFFKPIGQSSARGSTLERSTHFVRQTTALEPTPPMPLDEAERLIVSHRSDELMSRVVADFHRSAAAADIVIVEGLVHTPDTPLEVEINERLIEALSAELILVGALSGGSAAEFAERARLAAEQYSGGRFERVLGVIANRVSGAKDAMRLELTEALGHASGARGHALRLLGAVPDNPELGACRSVDVMRHLGAEVLNEGELATRRVKRFALLARTVPNLIHTLLPGSVLVTPCDRSDVVLAVAMAVMNAIPIAGLILTGERLDVPSGVVKLCAPAFATGLPVLRVSSNSWETVQRLGQMSQEIPEDDLERVQLGMSFIAEHLDADYITRHSQAPVEARMSPAAFCYRLTELAKERPARIVLPEGNEPRTVRAAAICAERNIARCVLLGDPEEVQRVAAGLEISLPPDVEVLDPAALRRGYVGTLVEMRRKKGMTEKNAAELLEDNVWLGTLMLARGEVDGLVSGAVHSTANTIRPALQIIKTKPDARVVSSIFFMCLPDQVLVYGDCAVNPDPDVETLCDIAIQSADSARRFGITPRVAMLSYSTRDSGSGSDVDKVREATLLVQQRRPDLIVDGPLQYDAAAIAEVAAQKAPNSPVAGRATVFVFPDLNTGNTTYKAVQRSANVVSIGPMLQGMNRPVNDLSRGALVEDIVYTIAITAVQARSE